MKYRIIGEVIIKLFFITVLSFLIYYTVKEVLPLFHIAIPPEYIDFLRGLIVAAAGIVAVNVVGNAVILYLKPTIRERAYAVGNTVKVVGFLFVIILALATSKFGVEFAALGGTVTGLVLGLALQPVLGNLFAGLLILATRFVTVGDVVRITTSQVPYQLATLPAYKYFSPDYVVPGFKGRVVEIGLFYTTLLLDTGYEIRVPNSVLLNAGVVDYTPAWSESQIVLVRVELPLSVIDLDKAADEIREELKDFDVVAVDFTEQSEKDFVIIRVKIRVPLDRDWRPVKSEALRRILKYRERKIKENMYKYLCLTKSVACDRFLQQAG